MSLVGPRPLHEDELLRYPAQLLLERGRVEPGLTCLAQLQAGHITYAEAMELDLDYIRTRSVKLDLLILARTVGTVVRSR